MRKITLLVAALFAFPLCACSSGTSAQDGGADQSAPPIDAGSDSTTPSDSGSDASGDASVTCDADAGQTLCGNQCVLTASNATHCGACNHDCLGGTCTAGMCQPITLATLAHPAWRLATDGTYVVWGVNDTTANGGGVFDVSVNGTNQTPFTILAQDNVQAVAIHTGAVYWVGVPTSQPNTIYKGTAGTAGGTATAQTLGFYNGGAAWLVQGLVLNSAGTTLAYLTSDTAASAGQVGSCPVSNFGSCQSISLTESYTQGGLATDDTNLYWSDVTASRIQKTTIAPVTASNFINNTQATPGHIVYDSNYLYWSVDGSPALARSPITNPVQAQVASANSPNGLAVDAKYVYISNGGNTIDYVPVTGGAPSTLAPANNGREIVRDSKALYYFNGTDMTLRKVALPL